MKNFFLFSLIATCSHLMAQINFTEVYFAYDDPIEFIDEILIGDLNGDDKVDFVISWHVGKDIYVGFNNQLQKPLMTQISDGIDARKLVLTDFDRDGDLDLIGTDVFDAKTYWWENNGSGAFTIHTMNIAAYDSILFSDIDDDQIDEMIVGIDDGLSIYELTDGVASLSNRLIEDVFAGSVGAIQILDHNDDGLVDIAGAFDRDGVKVFQQTDSGLFTKIDITPSSFINSSLCITDINDDGQTDFLLHSIFYRQTTLLRSTSEMTYEEIILEKSEGDNEFSFFKDINNQGGKDILYIEADGSFDGTISIMLDQDGNFNRQIISTMYSSIESGGIADFDGDGDQDLYVFTNDFFNPGIVLFLQESVIDADKDGFAAADDCDDNNPNINPGKVEQPYNGLDDDCDALTLDDDLDMDGFLNVDDCDDSNPGINTAATEIPNNGIDEDCDGNDLTTSIHKLGDVTVNIFPNPVSDLILINIDRKANLSISLFDLQGRKIISDSSSLSFDLSFLRTGIYFLEIKDEISNQRIIDRIVVAR